MKFKGKTATKLYKRLVFFALPVMIWLYLSAFSVHPYYMTVTELVYKTTGKEVQITTKIFTDDLEAGLQQELKQPVNLSYAADKKKHEAYIITYLQKHLKLTFDHKPAAYTMLGFEEQEGAIWIYLSVKNITKIKSAVVFNDVLYSLRSDQINIIHFTSNGIRKSYRLSAPEATVKFNW